MISGFWPVWIDQLHMYSVTPYLNRKMSMNLIKDDK